MNQDRWRDDERRREFERDREQYRGGYRARPGEFDYERDVYGERYARNEGWGGGRERFQGDRDRGGYGRDHEHEHRMRQGQPGGDYYGGGRMQGSDYYGAGRTQGSDYYGAGGQHRHVGYERNRGHSYDWNRGYDRNEPYRSREHEMSGRGGGYDEEGRSWWDKTRDEVGSWFGDEDAERRRREDDMHGGRGEGRYTGGYGERRHDTAWNDPVRGDDSHRRTDWGRDRFDERDYWREDHDRRDRRPW